MHSVELDEISKIVCLTILLNCCMITLLDFVFKTKSWENWYQLTQGLTTTNIIARIYHRNRGTFQINSSLLPSAKIKKVQHSNKFSFMRHNKRLIWVTKVEGKQKDFMIKKSHFSQKATVQIKNPLLHWICLFFWQHKPSSEPRKSFSCILATYIRTVSMKTFTP